MQTAYAVLIFSRLMNNALKFSQVVAVAIEAAEELTEDPSEPLTNLPEVTDIPNSNTDQPSRLSGYNLKRGLLNEDEALEIILKGGSGFGTPKLGQSPIVTDSPKVGSYSSTDASHIRKPATLRERIMSSSPTTNLSESCPTSCQILSISPQIKHPFHPSYLCSHGASKVSIFSWSIFLIWCEDIKRSHLPNTVSV